MINSPYQSPADYQSMTSLPTLNEASRNDKIAQAKTLPQTQNTELDNGTKEGEQLTKVELNPEEASKPVAPPSNLEEKRIPKEVRNLSKLLTKDSCMKTQLPLLRSFFVS